MNLTSALQDLLEGDSALVAMLSTYKGNPAIFTIFPVPGDAQPPYIVSAGDVADVPFDTKITRGREVLRDVRAYAKANGSAVVVEAIAERVRALLHRRALSVDGFQWVLSSVTGPIAVDETGYYGRVISVSVTLEEN